LEGGGYVARGMGAVAERRWSRRRIYLHGSRGGARRRGAFVRLVHVSGEGGGLPETNEQRHPIIGGLTDELSERLIEVDEAV
jgi:hypothetical protein